jgi:hypothetical protein
MHCTLLVPDLLLPSASDVAILRDLHLPALALLLGRARRTPLAASSMEQSLCETYGVARQNDWPVAPLALLGDGGEPGDACWLRSDPVHLRAHRSELRLADSSAVAPEADEARQLIAALNAHFATDSMHFLAPHPQRWYLRLQHAPALITHMLPEAAGRNINSCMPAGDAGLAWHRRLNEIQMLLHAHPVNQAREAHDRPMINSVWLWGGGTLPAVHAGRYTHIWSDDALASGLAAAAHVQHARLPPAAATVLAATATPQHLVVMPQLRAAACNSDLDRWLDELRCLERDWMAPLERALRQGRLSALAIVSPATQHGLRWDIDRADLWKLWRTPRLPVHV